MQPTIMIGNSITAEILYDLIKDDSRYQVEAFSVDEEFITEKKLLGLDVIALENLASMYDTLIYKIIIAVGYGNINRNREALFHKVNNFGFETITYVHQDAKIFSKELGKGSIIMPGAVLEPYTKIGANTVIWSNCTIAHHAVIEENCWIASGSVVSGEARIGKNTFMGVNSTIVNKVTVSEYNIIGAHTLVSKNTKPNEVYLARSGEKHRFNSQEYTKFYGL
ncbi:MAG: acetyltransferase [Deltaproteobacteria bacterium]|nr:acetyltransferase [Deltaproteobacteria bacterium]